MWETNLRIEDDHVMVRTLRPAQHYELLDGPTDTVLKTIDPMRSLRMSNSFAAKSYFVEWDFNGGSNVRRTSDFATLPPHFGLRGEQGPLAVAEGILYLCDPQNLKLTAVDLETGAPLANASSSGTGFGARVVLGAEKVFVVGDNGKVTAFPLFSR